MNKKETVDVRGHGINWAVLLSLAVFHVGAVAAPFAFSWSALITAVALYWVGGSLGIGMGYHRLLAHRGYRVPKVVEYGLTLCGTLALEGGPVAWVATHRLHHAHSDRGGDPHSPRDGAWWAHIGWICQGAGLRQNPAAMARYAPDLTRSRFHVWLTRWFFLPIIALGLLLLGVGGWPFLLWGICLRVVIGWHATWLVNSAAHLWGKRRFVTRDDSRNNWWVALLSFGEGWHNNHHAHPAAARHGLAPYELDLNWWGIRTLQLLGLAEEINLVRLAGAECEPRPPTQASLGDNDSAQNPDY